MLVEKTKRGDLFITIVRLGLWQGAYPWRWCPPMGQKARGVSDADCRQTLIFDVGAGGWKTLLVVGAEQAFWNFDSTQLRPRPTTLAVLCRRASRCSKLCTRSLAWTSWAKLPCWT